MICHVKSNVRFRLRTLPLHVAPQNAHGHQRAPAAGNRLVKLITTVRRAAGRRPWSPTSQTQEREALATLFPSTAVRKRKPTRALKQVRSATVAGPCS
jgi:hypothetical protein